MNKPRRRKRKVSGILLLNKPEGYSSNKALLRVRALYGAEKAGHTGSLDPLATGLLPICFGQATKLCGHLLDSNKRYRATARFGEKTRTGDAEGAVIARSDASGLSQSELLAVLPEFTGTLRQIPPMFSALKHEGQRLYELARENVEIARQPREITIHELELIGFSGGEMVLDVRCSKGTYIRTLVEDIAEAMGQCAHLTALHRLEVEPFDGQKMITLAEVEQRSEGGYASLDALLLPTGAALSQWPRLILEGAEQIRCLRSGQPVRLESAPDQGEVAIFDGLGQVLCLARAMANRVITPKRWLADDDELAP
jgi:tRNA pseudouridine55 synthase